MKKSFIIILKLLNKKLKIKQLVFYTYYNFLCTVHPNEVLKMSYIIYFWDHWKTGTTSVRTSTNRQLETISDHVGKCLLSCQKPTQSKRENFSRNCSLKSFSKL